MNYEFKFTIPGNPIPKQRAKFSSAGKFVRVYDPQEKIKKEFSEKIRNAYEEVIKLENIEIEMKASNCQSNRFFNLDLSFYMSIPESSKKSQNNAKFEGFEHAIKPDIDNLQKFFLDCANQILWPDDSMISSITASKTYSKNPRTEVHLVIQQRSESDVFFRKIMKIFEKEYSFEDFCFDAKELFINANEDFLIDDIKSYKFIEFIDFFKKYGDKIQKINQIIKKDLKKREKL